jgi:hypothetical protein
MVKHVPVKQPSSVREPIRVGDAVCLVHSLYTMNVVDVMTHKEHLVAETDYSSSSNKSASKDGYRLFDALAGIFIGTQYLSLYDRRAPNGTTQHLKYAFMFGTNIVFINPASVSVIARLADAIDQSEKKE